MKKILFNFLMLLLLASLIGCNNKEENISSKEAEKIATEKFEQDLQKYNEENNENIQMDDIELLQKETIFSSDSKAWEVKFNYKNSTDREVVKSSVARYGIDLKGNIIKSSGELSSPIQH
jgi:hypothetical protein